MLIFWVLFHGDWERVLINYGLVHVLNKSTSETVLSCWFQSTILTSLQTLYYVFYLLLRFSDFFSLCLLLFWFFSLTKSTVENTITLSMKKLELKFTLILMLAWKEDLSIYFMTYPEKQWCMSSTNIHDSWNTCSIEVSIQYSNLKIQKKFKIKKQSLQNVI